MDDDLSQVSRPLQFGDIVIGASEIVAQVQPFKLTLVCQYALDLVGQVAVPGFFIIKELGALGCIVDDLGDLVRA